VTEEAIANTTATGRQRAWTNASSLVRWFGALAGVGLVAGGDLAASGKSASAQQANYRPSKDAPTSWQDFALKLQTRLHERLAADDDATRLLHRLLEARGAKQASGQSVLAKVWVTTSGRIARLEFDGLDREVADALRHVFERAGVDVAPPSDMLQPLHLRLSLRGAG
jgi:hypothetical protein